MDEITKKQVALYIQIFFKNFLDLHSFPDPKTESSAPWDKDLPYKKSLFKISA